MHAFPDVTVPSSCVGISNPNTPRRAMAARRAASPGRPREWLRGSPIGSGSFGVVNLAMDKSSGKLFAVKSAPSGAGSRSLEQEFDILRGLDSPHVVRCLGHERSVNGASGEQSFHLFMEYMAGGNLSDILHRFGGALDEPVIRSYTKEILQGIRYLHGRAIVHCDLKCKNLLLGSSGNVKLSDLGSARRLPSRAAPRLTGDGPWRPICGTPLWMAPEVLRNEGVGFASDVWSLGCTVIEMATGTPPWSGELLTNTVAAVFRIACSGDTPRPPSNLSQEGLDFLSRCLQRDPKLRWSPEQLLDHPFITGSFEGCSTDKEGSCSPTSVLDEGPWDLEASSYSPIVGAAVERLPSSARCAAGETQREHSGDVEAGDEDVWHLVRSG